MNYVYLTVTRDKSQELVDILSNLYPQYKEIALNMLSKHYDIEEIAKLTNLSKEEIDLLRKSNTFS